MAAKTYHAVNQIRVGRGGGDADVTFEPGMEVTGLTKEQMVELWNAGVLEERDAEAQKANDERDAEIESLREQIAQLQAEKAAAAAAAGPAAEEAPPADAADAATAEEAPVTPSTEEAPSA